MSKKLISRRHFLISAGVTSTAAVLAACGPKAAPNPTTPVENTQPPADTAASTATPQSVVAEVPMGVVDWDSLYPRKDPRHWITYKKVEPLKKYSDLTLEVNHVLWGTPLASGETIDNNVVTKFLYDNMGLKYTFKWVAADPTAQWATALAADDYPEIMMEIPEQYFVQLLEADKLENIKDAYEKTASDLTKKIMSYPDAPKWKYPAKNGGIYALPGCWGTPYSASDLLWIRQDLLDKVGITKMPDTLDEVEAAAKAFLNAKLVTIGITTGNGLTAGGWGAMNVVYGAYGTCQPDQWVLGADGTLHMAGTEPAQKDALARMAQWYKDGLFETDFVKRNDAYVAMSETAGAGKSGICFEPNWAPGALQGLLTSVPTAKWVFGPPPAGPDGKRGYFQMTNTGTIHCFKKGIDPLKLEAFFNQLNWYNEIMNASRLGYYVLFEGYDYNIDENNKYKSGGFATYYVCPAGWEATLAQGSDWWQGEAAKRQDALVNADPQGKNFNPVEMNICTDPTGAGQLTRKALQFNLDPKNKALGKVSDWYWPSPQSWLDNATNLNKRMLEVYTAIVTGTQPIDAWDAWVKEWKAQGGDQATADFNKSYQAHKA